MSKCMWKKLADDLNSSTGKDIKRYSLGCLKCDGLNIKCRYYLESPDLGLPSANDEPIVLTTVYEEK